MQSRTGLYIAAWTCLIIETGSLSFLKKLFGIYGSPLIYLFSGVILTILLLKIARVKKKEVFDAKSSFQQNFLIVLAFAIISFLGWLLLRSYFDAYPIDPSRSDIIPLIKILVKRFSSGEKVYREINDFGYTMYPNYLPMTWMPFWFADQLKLDYRTWAFGIFSFCIFISVLWLKGNLGKKMALLVLPFIIFLVYLWQQPSAFGWTVEPMISGFYLLLLFGISRNNLLLIAIALTCCLLSRYAVILFLPFLFFVYFFFISKRKAGIITGIVAMGVIVLLVAPFLIHQPEILRKGYEYYSQGALAEWKGQSWQQPGDLPFQLSQGYGFAIFFYNQSHVEASLNAFQKIHLLICILVPLPLTAWYFIKGKNSLLPQTFLILLLNLYLIFFFAFIQVPYAYLFFTPIVLSSFATALLTSYTSKK